MSIFSNITLSNLKLEDETMLAVAVQIPSDEGTTVTPEESAEQLAEIQQDQIALESDLESISEAEEAVAEVEEVVEQSEEVVEDTSATDDQIEQQIVVQQEAFAFALGKLGYSKKHLQQLKVNTESVSSAREKLKLHIEEDKGFIKKTWENIKKLIVKVWEFVSGMIKKIINWAKGLFVKKPPKTIPDAEQQKLDNLTKEANALEKEIQERMIKLQKENKKVITPQEVTDVILESMEMTKDMVNRINNDEKEDNTSYTDNVNNTTLEGSFKPSLKAKIIALYWNMWSKTIPEFNGVRYSKHRIQSVSYVNYLDTLETIIGSNFSNLAVYLKEQIKNIGSGNITEFTKFEEPVSFESLARYSAYDPANPGDLLDKKDISRYKVFAITPTRTGFSETFGIHRYGKAILIDTTSDKIPTFYEMGLQTPQEEWLKDNSFELHTRINKDVIEGVYLGILEQLKKLEEMEKNNNKIAQIYKNSFLNSKIEEPNDDTAKEDLKKILDTARKASSLYMQSYMKEFSLVRQEVYQATVSYNNLIIKGIEDE